jgi:hypothetical protein
MKGSTVKKNLEIFCCLIKKATKKNMKKDALYDIPK